MMKPEAAWKATLGELELQMTKATFNTWLKDARLVDSNGSEYVVGVRNDYAKDWLENRLKETILRTLIAISGQPATLSFEVYSEFANGNGSKAGSDKKPADLGNRGRFDSTDHASHRIDRLEGKSRSRSVSRSSEGRREVKPVGLKENYIFSSFVVGESNRLAHAAALSVSENPGTTYNPLFIYGGVGLGKTHLLHAIGHKCAERGLKVCYVSSETFTNELIQSIRTQQTEIFREKYRTTDVLLIDDIQFIAGKESTQEELFHTFNDLHSRGKQVVLSSDRPPKAMATLQARLQSRFEWGLMTDVQMPNIEMRMAILRSKAESFDTYIPNEVIEAIAHQVRQNIRELEGALNKVLAYAQLTNSEVDMGLVKMALVDLVQKQDKITVSRVIDVVSEHYNISRESILGSGRSRAISFPRQMAMYLARTETSASFPQIGNQMGKRDHTTILHGYEKISELVETDPNIRQDMLVIKSTLYSG